MKADIRQKTPTVRAAFPAARLAAAGIGATWVAAATAETLLGNGQDNFNDVGMLSDNYALITAAGLLHWAGGIFLLVGLAGLAPLLWAGRLGRAALLLTAPLAVGLGAFAMLHLVVLETAAEGLNGPAMNQFLIQRLGEGNGPWIIPIIFVAVLGPWSFLLLLTAMVRAHLTHWAAPALFAAGALLHMLVHGEIIETVSLWVMAAGALIAAVGILRSGLRTHLQPTTLGLGTLNQQ